MVTPGDICPCADVREIFDTSPGYGPSFPWYPNVGNHEMPGEGDESYYGENMDYLRQYYWDRMSGAVNPGPPGCVETTYSFDAGPVHIVCINEYWNGQTAPGSDVAVPWGDVVPQLRAWLADDLANTTKKWRLVFGHEPAYPQPDEYWGDARHVGDSLDQNPANRDAFWDVLEEYHVGAYICGHTHRYSHYQPLGSDVWQIDCAQARGTGKYDTFLIIEADDADIRFDVYRSLDTGQFSMTDSWSLFAIPGDASGDWIVDIVDLTALAANWSAVSPGDKTWDQGDFNNDLIVDIVDLTAMAANWTPVGSPPPVPEPGFALLLLAGFPWLLRRRSGQVLRWRSGTR